MRFLTSAPPPRRRFDAVGPRGPRCLAPESYGTGASLTRACGLTRVAATLGDACVVVNVGLGDDWSFEEGVANSTSCAIWTFDCLNRDRAVPPSLAGRVQTQPFCLGAATAPRANGLSALSYDDLRAAIGLNGSSLPLALLRLDIEGWEYEALRAVVSSPGNEAPAQVALRLHFHVERNTTLGLPWRGSGLLIGGPGTTDVVGDRDKETGEIALFVDRLWRSGGYYVSERTDSPAAAPGSTELLLVRGPRHTEAYEDAAEQAALGHSHQCAARPATISSALICGMSSLAVRLLLGERGCQPSRHKRSGWSFCCERRSHF